MRISICGRVLLANVLAVASASVLAQDASAPRGLSTSIDLAVTYAAERAQLAPGNCGCFWLRGGGADAGLNLWSGLGVAISVTGDHLSNYAAGLDVNKVAIMSGPRYTYSGWALGKGSTKERHVQVFGQGLFGGVQAFNGAFPSASGLRTTADSFALETGGGVGLFFSRGFGVRLFEADYVRTKLPNNYSNTQNDLRLSAGLSYHFGSGSHLR
jgi:outer membrane immunogenic protein